MIPSELMLYRLSLTIPANTPVTSPERVNIRMLPGVIKGLRLDFPPGCCGLARVVILEKEFQLWPSIAGTYFNGDTFPHEWLEDIELREGPYELTLVGWNLDNLYEHTVTLSINIVLPSLTYEQYLQRLMAASVG